MSLQLVPSVGSSGVVVSLMFNFGRFKFKLRGIHGVPMSKSFSQS